jgi:hypothetical protein
MIIGAMARMGIVCDAMIHGRSERPHMDDADRERHAQDNAEGEPDQRRRGRDARVIGEAAARIELALEHRFVEFLGDLVRRRQQRPLHRPRRFDEVARRPIGLVAERDVDDLRRVEPHRGAVPDREQSQDHGRQRQGAALAPLRGRCRKRRGG